MLYQKEAQKTLCMNSKQRKRRPFETMMLNWCPPATSRMRWNTETGKKRRERGPASFSYLLFSYEKAHVCVWGNEAWSMRDLFLKKRSPARLFSLRLLLLAWKATMCVYGGPDPGFLSVLFSHTFHLSSLPCPQPWSLWRPRRWPPCPCWEPSSTTSSGTSGRRRTASRWVRIQKVVSHIFIFPQNWI